MPNPKYRLSASRRNKRRSHLALTVNRGALCSNCQSVRYPHRACPSCGFYKGRQVMEPRSVDREAIESFDPNAI